MTSRSDPRLAAAVLDTLPAATLVVGASFRIAHANAAARAALGARAGASLADVLACGDGAPGPCARCRGCAIHGAVSRALAGEPARARGFVPRSSPTGVPADLHLLATAAPFRRGRASRALLVLQDVDGLLLDPAIVRICAGCGRVEDDEGCWYPLHRFLEDRLGLSPEALCDRCERGAR